MYTKPNGNSGPLKCIGFTVAGSSEGAVGFPPGGKTGQPWNFIKEKGIENETAVEEAKSTPPERYV